MPNGRLEGNELTNRRYHSIAQVFGILDLAGKMVHGHINFASNYRRRVPGKVSPIPIGRLSLYVDNHN